jgi:hypothetical protein
MSRLRANSIRSSLVGFSEQPNWTFGFSGSQSLSGHWQQDAMAQQVQLDTAPTTADAK